MIILVQKILNILQNARSLCDKLIVGVTTDELVSYKNKKAVIPFIERLEIVKNIKCVDVAIVQPDMDKFKAWEKLKFNVLFVGDDWFNVPKWKDIELNFKDVGVNVVYFPYTKSTSSTLINKTLENLRTKNTE